MPVRLGRFNVRAAAKCGADLHLRHPSTLELFWDGESPVTITLMGKDAPEVRDAYLATEPLVVKGEIDRDEQMVRVLIVATVAWSGLLVDGSEDCTPDNIRKLYTMEETEWVLEQVIPFFADRPTYATNMPSD